METILTPEQRVARAKAAIEARWSKRFNWDEETIESCKDELANLRAEAERGGLILQRRMSAERVTVAECYNPDCLKGPLDKDGNKTRTILDIASGRFAGCRSRINGDTGIMETAYACSAACYLYVSANFKHGSVGVRDVPVINEEPDVVNNEAAISKVP